MTRKTLGLTGTRKKDPKPVATETEAKVEVESEAVIDFVGPHSQ